jgi:hypothetical protein
MRILFLEYEVLLCDILCAAVMRTGKEVHPRLRHTLSLIASFTPLPV